MLECRFLVFLVGVDMLNNQIFTWKYANDEVLTSISIYRRKMTRWNIHLFTQCKLHDAKRNKRGRYC